MTVTSSAGRPVGASRPSQAKAELLDQLVQGVLELTSSTAWARWLQVSRRFHSYSFQNQILILNQHPDATWVAGYRAWLRLGRQVRQGERAIRILAPCLVARERVEGEEPPPPVLLGFRVAHVFDLAQTTGAELPQPVRTLTGPGPAEQLGRLARHALDLEFDVQFTALRSTRNGDCSHVLRRIRVSSELAPAHQLKTLAHELAHAVLHGPEFQGSRSLAELEAESVAYVVCQELGVESRDYSFGYLATWSGGGPEAARLVTAAGGRILRAASSILDTKDDAAAR